MQNNCFCTSPTVSFNISSTRPDVLTPLSPPKPHVYSIMLQSSWYGIRCPTSSSLQPNLSMDLSLQEVLKFGSVTALTLLLAFKIVFVILVPLHFHVNFRIILSISTKKVSRHFWWRFCWIHNLRRIEILALSSSP